MTTSEKPASAHVAHSESPPSHSAIRRVLPAVGLFFLSPWVAEFLLGNISIDVLWILFIIAPLYGGGAVLVRELARRSGRGWPTIMLLALAYALLEEGLVTQTLFSPTYFGYSLIQEAHIPYLGIGGWWTIFVLTLHTVWSIAVPIALVETFTPRRATTPWLGRTGLIVAAVLFVFGGVLNFYATYQQERFLASPWQWIGTLAVAAALVAVAFAIRKPQQDRDIRPPRPWVVGLTAFLASSAFLTMRWFISGWSVVTGYIILFGLITSVVVLWSRRQGWNARHRLALAAGATLTYAWHSFIEQPIIGSTGDIDLIGNIVFSLAAIALLAAAARTVESAPVEG